MNRKILFVVSYCMLIAAPSLLLASDGGSFLPSASRLAIAFVVVVMLIYASVHTIRKMFFKSGDTKSGLFRSRATFPLGQRARLNLVEISGRMFLLGVTDHQISILAEFDPAEIGSVPAPSGISGFVRHLQNFSRRDNDAKESSTG